MSLVVEYERPYQRNQPESLQNIILKVISIILDLCIQKN